MKILHSLRWRIQLWHGIFLFAVLLGLGIAAYRFEKAAGLKRLDDELRKRSSALLNAIPRRGEQGPPGGRRPPPPDDPFFENDFDRPPPDRPRPGGGRFRLPGEYSALFDPSDATGYYYILWRQDGEMISRSATGPQQIQPPPRPPLGRASDGSRENGGFRESYVFTPPGDCILVGGSTAPERIALQNYLRWLAGIEAGILLLGLGGGWWATSRALRPLKAIASTASDIADGHLEKRIPLTQNHTELGELATRLNTTFAKLEASFARQAQFTSDAAHELRTPLSVVISQAQLALRGERQPAEYREMFEASLRAARRMQKLTQSLLELARLDNHAAIAERVPCDLAILAAETTSILELAASEKSIRFSSEYAEARCTADPDAIIRIILNLLSNALEHSPENSVIHLQTRSDNGQSILAITDHGPGIASKHLPHLFDRFYRADESRNRKTGGTGLGLAICKSIAKAHHGSISVSSKPGEGSTFTLSLPQHPA